MRKDEEVLTKKLLFNGIFSFSECGGLMISVCRRPPGKKLRIPNSISGNVIKNQKPPGSTESYSASGTGCPISTLFVLAYGNIFGLQGQAAKPFSKRSALSPPYLFQHRGTHTCRLIRRSGQLRGSGPARGAGP